MKKDNIKLYIMEISLMIFLLCCAFFAQILTRKVIAAILVIFMIITEKLIKSYKSKGKYNKEVTVTMCILGIAYVAIIYIIGIYTGFYVSTVKFSGWTIINYIIPYIVIIASIENIRKTILLKNDKKANIIILIITVILDIVTTINIAYVTTLTDYYMLIGFIMFASIANNLLCNHIIIKYRNCRAIIAYKIITTLYMYIIPITPDIHILFESIIRIIIPYLIYLILNTMYSKKEINVSMTAKTRDITITSVLMAIVIAIIMLVSCQFKYGILVIGSGSMTGTINLGDAIIYEQLDKKTIEKGDIIVFNSDDVKIIHRVIDKRDSGTGMKYFTKGDANPNRDEGFRTEEDIIGKVKLRIPYIGRLALLLNNLFE